MYHFIKGKDIIICITFMSFVMQNLCTPIMFGHIHQPDISKKKLWDFNVHISELICLSLVFMNVKYFRKMYCTIIFGVKTCSAACIVAVIVCMCSVVPPKLVLAIVGLPISSVDRALVFKLNGLGYDPSCWYLPILLHWCLKNNHHGVVWGDSCKRILVDRSLKRKFKGEEYDSVNNRVSTVTLLLALPSTLTIHLGW